MNEQHKAAVSTVMNLLHGRLENGAKLDEAMRWAADAIDAIGTDAEQLNVPEEEE